MSAVITTTGISKRYALGSAGRKHDTFRDVLTDLPQKFFRAMQPRNGHGHPSDSRRTIWALKDISFDVQRGQVVGIVGRNGAGKSTLLKVLSRITEPTEGQIEIRGRVNSLLEVGTGFHTELTGRENIYLNGAILGMSKRKIDSAFDEIVAFAETDKFLDTPVKHYSSGMYMRLAFAVAAHLDSDILLVDEVLSVGDAAFQEKCLGKIRMTARSGKTVVFVSHNMASVQALCHRAILLDRGRVVVDSSPSEVIRTYLSDAKSGTCVSLGDWPDRKTNGEARIQELHIADGQGQPATVIPAGSDLQFTIVANFNRPVVDPCFGIIVHSATGEPLVDIRSIHSGLRSGRVRGPVKIVAVARNLWLYPGHYVLSPWIADSNCSHDIDYVRLCATLTLAPASGDHGDLKLDPLWGKYWVPSTWSVQ